MQNINRNNFFINKFANKTLSFMKDYKRQKHHMTLPKWNKIIQCNKNIRKIQLNFRTFMRKIKNEFNNKFKPKK